MDTFIGDVAITIVSKCGQSVEDRLIAPTSVPVSVLPLANVGRCDHTYAFWMANAVKNLDQLDVVSKESVIVFLKDDMNMDNLDQIGTRRTFKELLRIVSVNDFACSVKPGVVATAEGRVPISLSAYHHGEILNHFSMVDYVRGNIKSQQHNEDEIGFASAYANLGEWATKVGARSNERLVPVCYGGCFAVRGSQIADKGELWSVIETTLQRGNNIEEGHFANRSWAHLWSRDLTLHQTAAIIEHSDGFVEDDTLYHGALARRVAAAQQEKDSADFQTDAENLTSFDSIPSSSLLFRHLLASHSPTPTLVGGDSCTSQSDYDCNKPVCHFSNPYTNQGTCVALNGGPTTVGHSCSCQSDYDCNNKPVCNFPKPYANQGTCGSAGIGFPVQAPTLPPTPAPTPAPTLPPTGDLKDCCEDPRTIPTTCEVEILIDLLNIAISGDHQLAAKAVRLAFHDAGTFNVGTDEGGANGCLMTDPDFRR